MSLPIVIQSFTIPVSAIPNGTTLATFTKPAGGYKNFVMIQTLGTRPNNIFDFFYNAILRWSWTISLIAAVPGWYFCFNPDDGRVTNCLDLNALSGSSGSAFEAPDQIVWKTNVFFNVVAEVHGFVMWW